MRGDLCSTKEFILRLWGVHQKATDRSNTENWYQQLPRVLINLLLVAGSSAIGVLERVEVVM